MSSSNFIGFFKANLGADGVAEFGGGIAAHVKLPFYNAQRDTGSLVVPIFNDPAKYSGKIVLGAAEYLTLPEAVAVYQKGNSFADRVFIFSNWKTSSLC